MLIYKKATPYGFTVDVAATAFASRLKNHNQGEIMAKNGTCELCGLPDNSYSIESDGKVFKVCKLCYDGFIDKHGSDSADITDDELAALAAMPAPPAAAGKPETLSPDQMAKLLTPTSEERRKLNAALKRAAARAEQSLAADTEDLKLELLRDKAEIEKETTSKKTKQPAADGQKETDMTTQKSSSEAEQDALDRDLKAARAEEKRAAAMEKAKRAANPTIDDERIKITSPEVALQADSRPKTNFDVATKEHVSSVRFIEAFKYVMHPVVYAIFAGMVVLAVATALMITVTWQAAVIDFFAGAGAAAIGALLVWYLKRRFEIDRRTYLLRIRQEQIAFDSVSTPCYRELKTKYPIIKALGWLLSKLAVIIPVITIIGGTVTAVILTFLQVWWLLAPVVCAAAIGGVLTYYIFKFFADYINYKLDIERNQQLIQQTLLDVLSKKK